MLTTDEANSWEMGVKYSLTTPAINYIATASPQTESVVEGILHSVAKEAVTPISPLTNKTPTQQLAAATSNTPTQQSPEEANNDPTQQLPAATNTPTQELSATASNAPLQEL